MGYGIRPVPAIPDTVIAHLTVRFDEEGVGVASLQMARAAIGMVHELADEPNPAMHKRVKQAMKGFRRRQAVERGKTTNQAKPLGPEAVATIRGHLGESVNGKHGASLMAMISMMADSGLRRSEVVALRWADIERQANGSGRISVQHSKTDQSGEGAVVAITETAMDDLDRWRDVQGGGDRPFPLTGETVRHRIAKAAKDAGLGEGFSGHSPRVGMAVRMVERGAPENAVMQQGRWRTSAVVGRYTKKLKAGEALRYL